MLDKISVSIGVSIASAGQLITAFSLANALATPFVILAIARFDANNHRSEENGKE
ncbi:hypothetical protein [Pectinatus frisingensis]|uniref:hypothetical protein n=1 Tax=Pectinatus frisingensis TaxID=865 RepID=UPI0018C5773C|nr:hypothetical protein [Pectinatus frisingensis]